MPGNTLHSLDELVTAGLTPDVTPELREVAAQFSVAVTSAMVDLIDRDDAHDPIAAQFIPSIEENRVAAEELSDPIGDARHEAVPGLIHRYPDRVLLKPLHACAVYCRFCFRREQVGAGSETMKPEELRAAFDYIRAHEEIWEVILSGGDPLLLSDRRLAEIIGELNDIPHVKIIRIHTRIPVVSPERVTPELITALRGAKPVYVLLHCNHARELTDAARAACARLVDAGIPMLSQSVLLRGINDSAEALRDLMRAFVECRVKPHYLHHPDLARGTGHFRVPLAEGQALMRALRGHLSGLCQPTYILDIPGGNGKVPISPVYAREEDGTWCVRNHKDEMFDLPDGF
ncbi:MAG: lysine-2,3-aminomutase-like protein [Alphaproteobacteria bacterium]|nr:lysine-2,3-aminomutase-like protein [Alphaproteobacteria bacterium]